jgi:hypothetical protein
MEVNPAEDRAMLQHAKRRTGRPVPALNTIGHLTVFVL